MDTPDETASAGTLLDESKFSTTQLHGGTVLADALAYLEYPSGSTEVLAHKLDLNGDGVDDYIVASYQNILCGTGGCPFVVLDGRSGSELGTFFGFVAVLASKIDGYSVIQIISRRSADSSGLSTYVYRPGGYQLASHSVLQPEAVAMWRRALDSK